MCRKTIMMMAVGLCCIAGNAKADTQTLDNLAACSGLVIGNGAIDFFLGDAQAFDDAAHIAYSAYFSEALVNSHNQNDLMIADKILAANVDKVIAAYNSDSFDNALYEEIVICYRKLSMQLANNPEALLTHQETWQDLKDIATTTMKRMLAAG